jgi:hypothetical protein
LSNIGFNAITDVGLDEASPASGYCDFLFERLPVVGSMLKNTPALKPSVKRSLLIRSPFVEPQAAHLVSVDPMIGVTLWHAKQLKNI